MERGIKLLVVACNTASALALETLRARLAPLPVIGVVVLICLIGIFRIRVETNPVGYLRDGTQVKNNFNDIYQTLSGSFPINIVMGQPEADYFEDAQHLADIARMQEFLVTLPGVDKTLSYADYLKLVNYVLNHFEPKYYTLPKEGFEVRMVGKTRAKATCGWTTSQAWKKMLNWN